jgi:hypothetical protein
MPRNVQWNIVGNHPSTIHMDLASDLTLENNSMLTICRSFNLCAFWQNFTPKKKWWFEFQNVGTMLIGYWVFITNHLLLLIFLPHQVLVFFLEYSILNFIVKVIFLIINLFNFFGNNCQSCIRVNSQIPTLRTINYTT